MAAFAHLETDVVVVGTGGAGCRAALAARSAGARVLQIAKGQIGRCELTVMTMPGFGALLPSNPRDSRENYFVDTIDGGSYLNDHDLVGTLVDGSADAIGFLEHLGIRFDRTPDGTFMFYSGVEHTKTATPRQLAVDDCMGRAFYNLLSGEIARSGVELLEDTFVVSLLTDGERIAGISAFDIREGRPLAIWAKSVILATGGLVGLYSIRTGHPRDTADGQAMALRAGVPLKDIEFVQSNPAAFFYPESIRGVVVPGWYLVMDRGAKYYNGLGEEFLQHYDPVRKENTTRDIKARAMQIEIAAGRGTEHGAIHLDFTKAQLDVPLEQYLSENAPFLLGYLQRIGLPPDVIFSRPMEVGPAAHYSCGGVAIDRTCRTELEGLFAAGEVTGGVHGANRLGNNAMTDIFVFGKVAGLQAAEHALSAVPSAPSPGLRHQAEALEQQLGGLAARHGGSGPRPAQIRTRIEEIMTEDVGFRRNHAGLTLALDELGRLQDELLPRVTPASASRTFNHDLVEAFELENLLQVGRAVATAALERTETRGCHNRSDYPALNDSEWSQHLLVRQQGPRLSVERCPVTTSGLGE